MQKFKLLKLVIAVLVVFTMLTIPVTKVNAKVNSDFLFEANRCIVTDSTSTQLSSWMSQLSDDTKISQMTIPGSHDSGTKWVIGLLPLFAQCQDLYIDQQLIHGIRAFDLRYVYTNGNFYIYHGYSDSIGETYICMDKSAVKLTLEKCLKYYIRFLMEHPNEVIFVNFQKEGGDYNNEALSQLLEKYAVITMTEENMNTLTLGDLRGHIVDASCTIGHATGDYNDWNASRSDKVAQLTRVFDSSLTYDSANVLHTTYASLSYRSAVVNNPSGELSGLEYYTVRQQATFLYENILKSYNFQSGKAYGFVMMDFVKDDVITKLINCNNWALND